jgi:hypothetical protein
MSSRPCSISRLVRNPSSTNTDTDRLDADDNDLDALAGPFEDIPIPKVCQLMDYEARPPSIAHYSTTNNTTRNPKR